MKKFANSYIFGFLFVIFSLWIRLFDVQPVGPEGSSIGFAALNVAVHDFFGMHIFWYKLTQALGLLAIAVAGVFAVTGLVQLIQRKSLLKVDKKILMLGVIYILVILLYALFEKVPFNYRPVVLDPAEGLEPSYPSTHTMIILTIFGTAVGILSDYIKNTKLVLLLKIAALVIMAVTIIGRLICGVHWFTDIAGGVIISLFFINLFKDLTKETTKQ